MAERTEAVERNAILLAAMLPESPKTGRVILQKMPEGLSRPRRAIFDIQT